MDSTHDFYHITEFITKKCLRYTACWMWLSWVLYGESFQRKSFAKLMPACAASWTDKKQHCNTSTSLQLRALWVNVTLTSKQSIKTADPTAFWLFIQQFWFPLWYNRDYRLMGQSSPLAIAQKFRNIVLWPVHINGPDGSLSNQTAIQLENRSNRRWGDI